MSKRVSTVGKWIIVLVLFAGAGLLLQRDLRLIQHDAVLSPVGKAVPDATIFTLEGRATHIRALLGRPLWLNFFATWCVPCKSEMPAIEKEYRNFHRAGLEVIGLDQQEYPALVAAFVRPFGLTFPLMLDRGAAREAFHVFAIPTSVFVDRQGQVRAVHIGAMTAEQMEDDLKKIL